MHADATLAALAHVIQLSIAPVFLVSGIGALLAVLTNRLARIIDRARVLEGRLTDDPATRRASEIHKELQTLARRMRFMNWSITLCTLAALLVCLVIASMFIGTSWGKSWSLIDFSQVIIVLFITAMFSLIGGLLTFLREITIAIAGARAEMK